MSWEPWIGLAAWIGWFSWAVLCALVVRMALIALAGRTLPGIPRGARTMLAYAGMAVVLIASYRLHVAVLGEGQMYGSRAEQFSLAAYLVAPFGLPLLVGGSLVLIFDLLRCSFSPSSRPGHP